MGGYEDFEYKGQIRVTDAQISPEKITETVREYAVFSVDKIRYDLMKDRECALWGVVCGLAKDRFFLTDIPSSRLLRVSVRDAGIKGLSMLSDGNVVMILAPEIEFCNGKMQLGVNDAKSMVKWGRCPDFGYCIHRDRKKGNKRCENVIDRRLGGLCSQHEKVERDRLLQAAARRPELNNAWNGIRDTFSKNDQVSQKRKSAPAYWSPPTQPAKKNATEVNRKRQAEACLRAAMSMPRKAPCREQMLRAAENLAGKRKGTYTRKLPLNAIARTKQAMNEGRKQKKEEEEKRECEGTPKKTRMIVLRPAESGDASFDTAHLLDLVKEGKAQKNAQPSETPTSKPSTSQAQKNDALQNCKERNRRRVEELRRMRANAGVMVKPVPLQKRHTQHQPPIPTGNKRDAEHLGLDGAIQRVKQKCTTARKLFE